MANQMIRLLRANEIECRIATIKENGLSLLLYKDARVDQRILDETFGPFGWKRSHQCIDGNLYCTVEIYDKNTKTWIAKQDVGTTGYTEKEKSQASDSFKRACFNWGIGRELYTAPFIWISSEKIKIRQNGKCYYCNDHFSVRSIEYNEDREIIALSIVNDKGQLVYELYAKYTQQIEKQNSGKDRNIQSLNVITDMQLHSFEAELQRTGVGIEAVKSRYKINKPEEMSEELYNRVMNALAKTKSTNIA